MARLSPDKLRYEPFEHRRQLESFDCGNKGLNDFILNDNEVFSYQADFKSRAWLVREMDSWEVVGYYATYPSTLHQTHVKKVPRIRPDYVDHYWPALTVGRLAVQTAWQKRDIGRHIMTKITLDAIQNVHYPFRLLLLAAEPKSIEFYERLGYQKVEGKINKGKVKPLMFLDLKVLAEHLGLRAGKFPDKQVVDRH